MPENGDKILTDKLMKGDRQAFSTLFRQYYPDLVHFAHTFVKDRSTAEEVVQDVFIRLWENHSLFCVTVSLKSFLLKAVQNKCIDRIRHLRVRSQYQAAVLEHPLLYENNTEQYLLYSELQRDLQKALDSLPDELSGVFVMSRLQGRTYAEVAGKLNISVRTVETRIAKALAFLREQLGDYFKVLLIFFSVIDR